MTDPAPGRWKCGDCGSPVSLGMARCAVCGVVLTDDLRIREEPEVAPVPPVTRGGAGTATDSCPECGTVQPRAGLLICVECMAELGPALGRPGGHRVELVFRDGVVVVPAGPEVVIGRRGELGSSRLLGEKNKVSRRHLKIRVTPQGEVQVLDNISANGTFVNGRRLEPGWHQLPDNAHLRLGPDEVCRVRHQHP